MSKNISGLLNRLIITPLAKIGKYQSQRTVDGNHESIFSKLNLKSRTGIVLFAVGQGWVG